MLQDIKAAKGWFVTSETGLGYGIDGRLDIQVSNLVSIPIEFSLIVASGQDNGMDNLSGFGISSGVSFNF